MKDTRIIFCKVGGKQYNYLLLDLRGRLFSFGSNDNGMCGYPQMDKNFEERSLNIVSELENEYVVDFTSSGKKTILLTLQRDFICSYDERSDAEYQVMMRNLVRSNDVRRYFQRMFETKKYVLMKETKKVAQIRD